MPPPPPPFCIARICRRRICRHCRICIYCAAVFALRRIPIAHTRTRAPDIVAHAHHIRHHRHPDRSSHRAQSAVMSRARAHRRDIIILTYIIIIPRILTDTCHRSSVGFQASGRLAPGQAQVPRLWLCPSRSSASSRTSLRQPLPDRPRSSFRRRQVRTLPRALAVVAPSFAHDHQPCLSKPALRPNPPLVVQLLPSQSPTPRPVAAYATTTLTPPPSPP